MFKPYKNIFHIKRQQKKKKKMFIDDISICENETKVEIFHFENGNENRVYTNNPILC